VALEEGAGCIGAVDLEPLNGRGIAFGKSQIVKECAYIQKLKVWIQPETPSLKSPEEEDPAGMVEQQVAFGFPDEVCRIPDEGCIRDLNTGNGF
jgi:hypothetical protein